MGDQARRSLYFQGKRETRRFVPEIPLLDRGNVEASSAARERAALNASVNTARYGAYRQMLARGFRTVIQGVAMHRPNEPCYNRPDAYAIGDWR